MSDSKEQKPFATSGSGKSDAEVAFELLNKLKGQGIWGEKNMPAILDMYAECLDAVKGYRVYDGQKRLIAPIRKVMNHKIVNENAGANAISQRAQPAHLRPEQSQQSQQLPSNPTQQAGHTQPGQQAVHQPQPLTQSNPVQMQQQHLQQQIRK